MSVDIKYLRRDLGDLKALIEHWQEDAKLNLPATTDSTEGALAIIDQASSILDRLKQEAA